jgi:hypothetical protein
LAVEKGITTHNLEVKKHEGNIMVSANIILSAAKNALGNFSNFKSKKNIEPNAEEQKSNIRQQSIRFVEEENIKNEPY